MGLRDIPAALAASQGPQKLLILVHPPLPYRIIAPCTHTGSGTITNCVASLSCFLTGSHSEVGYFGRQGGPGPSSDNNNVPRLHVSVYFAPGAHMVQPGRGLVEEPARCTGRAGPEARRAYVGRKTNKTTRGDAQLFGKRRRFPRIAQITI